MFHHLRLLAAMAVVPVLLISETGGVTLGAFDESRPAALEGAPVDGSVALTTPSSESDPVSRVQALRGSLEEFDAPTDEKEQIIVTHVQDLRRTLADEEQDSLLQISVLRAFLHHTPSEDLTLFRALLKCLPHIKDFESQKSVTNFLRQVIQIADDNELVHEDVVDYVRNTGIVWDIVARHRSCVRPDMAHLYDDILRGFFQNRSPELIRAVMEAPPSSGTRDARPGVIFELFETAQSDNWEIASDALGSATALLLGDPETRKRVKRRDPHPGDQERLDQHRKVSASFLQANFEHFFEAFHAVMEAFPDADDAYVRLTECQESLSTLLLDRNFLPVMLRYVASHQNLKRHMKLLRNDSEKIQFEAFHVFKIFVANPKKTEKVQQILWKNSGRLVKLLEGKEFAGGRCRDGGEMERDMKTVCQKLKEMEEPPVN